MKHIIRINVGGKGYTLYSGGSSTPYREHPLDIQSPGIPDNYIPAQKRIDDLLAGSLHRPHICISNSQKSPSPLVAYGCNFPIEDEYGRVGISLIHAIQEYNCPTPDIVMSIVRFLNPSTMDEISEELASVAQGRVEPESFIRLVTHGFSNPQRIFKGLMRGPTVPIRSITHDCVGTALAWAAMSASHATTAPPWEIYDKYSSQEGLLSTISTAPSARDDYRLSEFIGDVVCSKIFVEQVSSDKKAVSQETPKTMPGQHTPPTHSDHHGTIPLPRSGCIVTPVRKHGQRDDQLWLVDESESYRVTLNNCLEIKEFPAFFRMKIDRPDRKFWTHRKYTQLVIFKAELSKEHKFHISRFFQYFTQVYNTLEAKQSTPPEVGSKKVGETAHTDIRSNQNQSRSGQGAGTERRITSVSIPNNLAIYAIITLALILMFAFLIAVINLV